MHLHVPIIVRSKRRKIHTLLFTAKALLGKLIFTISDINLLWSKVMERKAECYDASICKYVYMTLDMILFFIIGLVLGVCDVFM